MKSFAFAAAVIAASASASTCYTDTKLIKMGEGYESCMYYDSVGVKTVCYGFNLETGSAKSEVQAVGGDYNDVISGGCLTQSQCDSLLDTEVDKARDGKKSIYGAHVGCSCADYVLVDMDYNLGTGGLSTFTTFQSYIEAENWDAAADDLYTTLWCSQVGSRCSRDAEQIRGCANGVKNDAENLPLLAAPEFVAGFVYEMVGVNHLTEIEACYQGGTMMLDEVQIGIADIKKGGWNYDVQAALEFALVALQVPQTIKTCQAMDEDIAAIEEWASIFTDPARLSAAVAKHYAFHKAEITADIATLENDFAAGSYFQAGEDLADLLTLAIGPIESTGPVEPTIYM